MPKVITSENFKTELLGFDGSILALFYADWAEPSMEMLSRLEQFEDMPTATVDIDRYSEIAHLCDVRAVPMLTLFKRGRPVSFKVGLTDLDTIRKWLADN